MTKFYNYIVILLVGLVAVSCGGSKESQDGDCSSCESQELSGKIRVDGSSTVFPITEAVAEEYDAERSGVEVIVNYSGTGGGFKKFTAGETDINDASRPIKDKEIKLCEENNVEYVELTVAYDGLAVVINKENDWAGEMTVEELKKLWEPDAKGVITKWSDIREGWPDDEIKLFGPGTASGTFDYFTEAIVGESGACRSDFSPSEDDNVLVTGVAGNKYALGFFGLAYYEENSDKLNLVAVDNGEGAVKPSMETVKNGSYAPLSRPLFIYVSKSAAAKAEVVDFVKYYLENAAELSADVGYIPLPEEEYSKQKASFESFIGNDE